MPEAFSLLAEKSTIGGASNISPDLVWEITRGNSSMLCKRRSAGGVQFSRDPLNVMNKHSKKYEGHISEQAIGVQDAGENGGVTLSTKRKDRANKPADQLNVSTFGKSSSNRKTYRSIVNSTAKRGYRPDLRPYVVARTSAILQSQRPKKDKPEPKLRGSKARKAQAESS